MRPASTPSPYERAAVPASRLAKIRIELQAMVNRLDDGENVYVNGCTFNADEFRYMLSCLKEPQQ